MEFDGVEFLEFTEREIQICSSVQPKDICKSNTRLVEFINTVKQTKYQIIALYIFKFDVYKSNMLTRLVFFFKKYKYLFQSKFQTQEMQIHSPLIPL